MNSVRPILTRLACLALVALAGCGHSPTMTEAPRAQTPSTSTSGSMPSSASSGTSDSITLPEDLPADEVDPEKIVRAWFEAYNILTLTGDPSRMRAISSSDCGTCASFAQQIERIYKDGGRSISQGPPHTVTSIRVSLVPKPPVGVRRLEVQFQSSAGKSKTSQYSKEVAYSASKARWLLEVVQINGRWRVNEVGV